jgi:hypothetical protein
MSGEYRKPTRWLYVLAALLPALACLGTALVVYQEVPELPGALEKTGLEDLTRVVVPGAAEIYFPEAGAYAVYHETRSVVDGVRYFRDTIPPGLTCRLRSQVTGREVELAASQVEGNVYTAHNPERVGQMIKTISVDHPGFYQFSCQYAVGGASPEIVLSVGPNLVWEFFNLATRPLAAILCGGAVFSGTLVVSLLIIGFTVYSRGRSRVGGPLKMNSHPQVCLRIRR